MAHTDDFEHSEFNCQINSNKNWKFTYLLALPILGRVTATVVAPITRACNSSSPMKDRPPHQGLRPQLLFLFE